MQLDRIYLAGCRAGESRQGIYREGRTHPHDYGRDSWPWIHADGYAGSRCPVNEAGSTGGPHAPGRAATCRHSTDSVVHVLLSPYCPLGLQAGIESALRTARAGSLLRRGLQVRLEAGAVGRPRRLVTRSRHFPNAKVAELPVQPSSLYHTSPGPCPRPPTSARRV